MTVAAIDAKTAHMVLMTEGHGLFSRLRLSGFVRRSHNHRARPHRQRNGGGESPKREPCDGIGCAVEELRHLALRHSKRTAPGLCAQKVAPFKAHSASALCAQKENEALI